MLSCQDIYPFNPEKKFAQLGVLPLVRLTFECFTVWKEFNDDSISIYIFIIEAWIAIRLYVTRAILHSLHSLVPRRILAFFSGELCPSPCRDFYRSSSHPSSLDPPPIWTSEITPDYSRDVLDWLTLIVKISSQRMIRDRDFEWKRVSLRVLFFFLIKRDSIARRFFLLFISNKNPFRLI